MPEITSAILVSKRLNREAYNGYDGNHTLIKYEVIKDPNNIFKPGDPIWIKEIPDEKQLRTDV